VKKNPMRFYIIVPLNGRISLAAYTPAGLDLFRADFSCTEIEAVLSMLRDELNQQLVEAIPAEAREGN